MKRPHIDLKMISSVLADPDGRLTILLAIASSPKQLSMAQIKKSLNVIKGIADLCGVSPEDMIMAINELKLKNSKGLK